MAGEINQSGVALLLTLARYFKSMFLEIARYAYRTECFR